MREDDDDSTPSAPPIPSSASNFSTDIDIEDAIAMEHPLGKHDTWVLVNKERVSKAKLLAEWLKYRRSPKSTDRLRRVADLSPYVVPTNTDSSDVIDFHSAFGGPCIMIDDPISTLVRCDDWIFLCIGQLNGIFLGTDSLQQLTIDLLAEKTVSVSYQIMRLVPTDISDCADLSNDWKWAQKYESSYTTRGRFILPLNPAVSTIIPGSPNYLFNSADLRSIAAKIFDSTPENLMRHLPEVKRTLTFPYRSQSKSNLIVTRYNRYMAWPREDREIESEAQNQASPDIGGP